MILLFLEHIEKRWLHLLWGMVLGSLFCAVLSFALPKSYSSTMRLLIVQANVAGLDPYTALKSTEQIAGSVRELVYTSLVANRVLIETKTFDSAYFSSNEVDRRKEWREAVEVSVAPGTGILSVSAYHPNREQATILVQGVAKQVIEQTPNFGYNAQARIIDTPLPSRWFARPNVLLNTGYGAMIGLFLALISVFATIPRSKL